MLNIWGVILYLRLPWITAQAGIGRSKQALYPLTPSFLSLFKIYICCVLSKLFFFLRIDLVDHLIILLYYWNHWSFNVSHRYQRKGQRRYMVTSIQSKNRRSFYFKHGSFYQVGPTF